MSTTSQQQMQWLTIRMPRALKRRMQLIKLATSKTIEEIAVEAISLGLEEMSKRLGGAEGLLKAVEGTLLEDKKSPQE